MSVNSNLHKAKREKNDEFYTQLQDISNELQHYEKHFAGKVIYCNCDDPAHSNFVLYFSLNFKRLRLKGLITNHYDKETGEGDFRSDKSIELLKVADIVVSNPPFSLWREYLAQLVKYNKKFLIIGNVNAITYKEVFPLIKDNKMWLGVNAKSMTFDLPSGETKNIQARWFTNLKHSKRNDFLILTSIYSPEKYPFYDNYNAINVNKVNDIPADTFIDIIVNEEQLESLKQSYPDLEVLEEIGDEV